MQIVIYIIIAVVCLAIGFIVSKFVFDHSANGARAKQEHAAQDLRKSAEQTVEDAKREAEVIKQSAEVEAKESALQIKQDAEDEAKEQSKEMKERENRIRQREEKCDERVDSLDKREHQLSSAQGEVNAREKRLEESEAQFKEEVETKEAEIQQTLSKISKMDEEQAREMLLDRVRESCTQEEATILRDSEAKIKSESDRRARGILSVAIQRMAGDYTVERTVNSVPIPSDDIKGRIIGREGRNIRSFEQYTGVNLIIDDTPDSVTISCFDPVRREIARITLENLIADGRIHPSRIEEMYKKATEYVDQQIQEAGEQATLDTGIHNLHPELVKTLGRLKYRTSYGQNVLQHSLEVAYLAGSMASELGLDPVTATRAGLLHDIGKAIDHEVEGSHAVIGADLARRFGESPDIVHAIEAHHADVEPSTVLAVLVQAADAVSAARPGARRESFENYIKRLENLEEIANSYDGVTRTYAMQAGREVRVMVEPSEVDDDTATILSHKIAEQIEEEMEYPGEIHVIVVRESRAESVAK
ncbi:MAG: ribonuclease Y [Coriobacteriaceae bacterium]|nr:ribonuclease Y [Coriobacteriaceae bacterium]